MKKVSISELTDKKIEILMALRRLDEKLSPAENEFFEQNASDSMKEFEKVKSGSNVDSSAILAAASLQVKGLLK